MVRKRGSDWEWNKVQQEERSAALGERGAFISSKSHLCVQLPFEKKDAMWKCLSIWCQTNVGCVAFALGGGSELSVLAVWKVSVFEVEKAGEKVKWEKEKGTDMRRGGLCVFFISFKMCRRQLQKPQLDSHSLHWFNCSLIWFHTHDFMSHHVCCGFTSEWCLLFLCFTVSTCEKTLSVSSIASWSITAGRRLYRMATQSQRRRRFWLRKLLGLNLIRPSVPFYWYNCYNRVICCYHTPTSCDNGNVFCLSHCSLSSLCVCWEISVFLLFIKLSLVCVFFLPLPL